MVHHTHNSSFREKLIEHLFIGELCKYEWKNELGKETACDLDISKPEVDHSGFDVIAESNKVIRHIQLKSSVTGAKTAVQKVHRKLESKSSGCVVWVYFDSTTLDLGPFLFFGNAPGVPLPNLAKYRTANHSKGNSSGHKAPRPNVKLIPKGDFAVCIDIPSLCKVLFG